MSAAILTIKELTPLTSLSRSTILRYIRAGNFPAPVKLGPYRIGFHKAQVEEWLASRPAR